MTKAIKVNGQKEVLKCAIDGHVAPCTSVQAFMNGTHGTHRTKQQEPEPIRTRTTGGRLKRNAPTIKTIDI